MRAGTEITSLTFYLLGPGATIRSSDLYVVQSMQALWGALSVPLLAITNPGAAAGSCQRLGEGPGITAK